jgi:hypothetical protein
MRKVIQFPLQPYAFLAAVISAPGSLSSQAGLATSYVYMCFWLILALRLTEVQEEAS